MIRHHGLELASPGPIEHELRSWNVPVVNGLECVYGLSCPAYNVYFDAWIGLGGKWFGHPQSDDSWPDIMSEAIEAAAELGL